MLSSIAALTNADFLQVVIVFGACLTSTHTHALKVKAMMSQRTTGPLGFEVCYIEESRRKLCLRKNKLSQPEDLNLLIHSDTHWEYDFTAIGQLTVRQQVSLEFK